MFAQIIGTLELMKPEEKLIKGIIINRFRGDYHYLKKGKWIENKTKILLLGLFHG